MQGNGEANRLRQDNRLLQEKLSALELQKMNTDENKRAEIARLVAAKILLEKDLEDADVKNKNLEAVNEMLRSEKQSNSRKSSTQAGPVSGLIDEQSPHSQRAINDLQQKLLESKRREIDLKKLIRSEAEDVAYEVSSASAQRNKISAELISVQEQLLSLQEECSEKDKTIAALRNKNSDLEASKVIDKAALRNLQDELKASKAKKKRKGGSSSSSNSSNDAALFSASEVGSSPSMPTKSDPQLNVKHIKSNIELKVLQEENDTLREQIIKSKRTAADNVKLKDKISILQAKLSNTNSDSSSSNNDNKKSMKRQLSLYKSQIESHQNNISLYKDKTSDLTNKLHLCQVENKALQDALGKQVRDASSSSSSDSDSELKKKISNLRRDLERYKLENASLQDVLAKQLKKSIDSDSSNELDKDFSQLRKDNIELKQKLRKYETENGALQDALASKLQRDITSDSSSESKDNYKSENKKLRKELSNMQLKYDNLYSQLGRTSKHDSSDSSELSSKSLQRKLTSLQNKYDNLYSQLGKKRRDDSSSSGDSKDKNINSKLLKVEVENSQLRKQIKTLQQENDKQFKKLSKRDESSSSDSSKDMLREFSKCRSENSDLRQRLAVALASQPSDDISSRDALKLKKETSRLKKTIKSLEDELADKSDKDRDSGATKVLKRTIKRLDSENAKLRTQLGTTKADHSSDSSSSSRGDLTQVRRELEHYKKELAILRKEFERKQRDNNFLQHRVSELEGITFSTPGREVTDADLRSELEDVQRKSLQQYSVNTNLQKRIQDLESQIEDLTSGGTDAHVQSLRSQLDEAQSQNERLYEDKLSLLKHKHENSRLKKQLRRGGSDSSDSSAERNDQLGAKIDKLQIENNDLIKTVNNLQRSIYEVKSNSVNENDELNNKIKLLKTENARLQSYANRSRSNSSSDTTDHAENLRFEIKRLQDVNVSLDSDIVTLRKKNSELESNLTSEKSKLDDVEKEANKSEKAYQTELRQLKSDSIYLQKQIRFLQEDDSSGGDSASSGTKKTKDVKLLKLQNEIQNLKNELQELQESHAADCDDSYQTKLKNIQLEDEIKSFRTHQRNLEEEHLNDQLREDLHNQAETIENLTSKIKILKHNEAQQTQKIASQSSAIAEWELKNRMPAVDSDPDRRLMESLQNTISTQRQQITDMQKVNQTGTGSNTSSDSDRERDTPKRNSRTDSLTKQIKDLEEENHILERQNLRLVSQITNRSGGRSQKYLENDSDDSSNDVNARELKNKISELKTENNRLVELLPTKHSTSSEHVDDDLIESLRAQIKSLENQNNRLLLLQQRTPTQQFVEGSRAADLELENQNLKYQVRSLSTPGSYSSPPYVSDDTVCYNRTRQKIAIILQARSKWLLTNRIYRMLWYFSWMKGNRMKSLTSPRPESTVPLPPSPAVKEEHKRVHVGITAATESNGTGVLIAGVHTNSVADVAGLQKDDIIIEMNRREILTPHDLVSVVDTLQPTDSTPVVYIRSNQILQTSLDFNSDCELVGSPIISHESPPRPIDAKCSPIMLDVQSPVEELRELKHEKEILNIRLERAETAVHHLQDKISSMAQSEHQSGDYNINGEGEVVGSSELTFEELQRNLMSSERRRNELESMLQDQDVICRGSDILLPAIPARVGELFVTTPSGLMLTLIHVVASDCEIQPDDILLKIGRQFVTTLSEVNTDLSHWSSSLVPITVLRPSNSKSSSTLLQLEINVSENSDERFDENDAPDSPTPPPTAPPPTLSRSGGGDHTDPIDIEVAWI